MSRKNQQVWISEFDDAVATAGEHVGDDLIYTVGAELDYEDPRVRAVYEIIAGEDDDTSAEARAIRELVGYSHDGEDVGFGVPGFVKSGAGFVAKAGKVAYGGAKKVHGKAKSAAAAVVRSPYMKYAAIGVTFVNPAAGASMMAGIAAADKILAAADAGESAGAAAIAKAREARALISRTKKAAARGDKEAQGGMKLLALAQQKRKLGPKRWKRFLVAAVLTKRARLKRLKGRARRRVSKAAARKKALARKRAMTPEQRKRAVRAWLAKRRQKRSAVVKKLGTTTPGFLVDHRGRVLHGKWVRA